MAIEGLNNLQISPLGPGSKTGKQAPLGDKSDFAGKLDGLLKQDPAAAKATDVKPLDFKFSNHAVERMRSRGITYSPETLQKIDAALTKAADKGAKETLIMADDSAMIVNIENKTVVTVMDKTMLKENIFTNIDAAAIV